MKTSPLTDQSPKDTIRERLRQSPVVRKKNAEARQLIQKLKTAQGATDPVSKK